MSNSLNKVQIIGNLTAEPEVRETPNGQKVATFSVATNRKWKDASGVLQEDTEFHNCVAWRGLADIAEQYMHKGKKVYVEGYLKTRNWEDTAWVKRYKTEIVSDNVILLSSPAWEGGGYSSASSAQYAVPAVTDNAPEEPRVKKSKPKAEEEISIEDIPF
jgi:single-strand DNA-binding protein